MSSHFADRLCDAVKTKKTPLIVGLDPVYNRLPKAITSHRELNDETDAAAAVDANSDYITTSLHQDAIYHSQDQVTDVDADTDVAIIWSDISSSSHLTTTNDWTGDYLVTSLPITNTLNGAGF